MFTMDTESARRAFCVTSCDCQYFVGNTVYSGADYDVAVGDVSCFVTDACRAGKFSSHLKCC